MEASTKKTISGAWALQSDSRITPYPKAPTAKAIEAAQSRIRAATRERQLAKEPRPFSGSPTVWPG